MYNKVIKSPLWMIKIIATYLYFRHELSHATVLEIVTSEDKKFINKMHQVEYFYVNWLAGMCNDILRTILAT